MIRSFFFGAVFGLLFLLAPAAPADDDLDFFADESAAESPVPADTPGPAEEAAAPDAAPANGEPADAAPAGEEPAVPADETPAADAPAGKESSKGGSFFSGFLSRFEKNDDGKSDYRTPIETVLPRSALMMAATSPVNTLNANLSELFKSLGLGKLSPADWVRLSPYGKGYRFVDGARPLGACWLNLPGKSEPAMVLFIPVRRYLPFIGGLGADVASYDSDSAVPAGTLFPLKKPDGWVSMQKNGYACLFKADLQPLAASLQNAPPVGSSFYTNPGLDQCDLRVAVTPFGIRRVLDLYTSADSVILTILPEILRRIRESNPDFVLTADETLPHLDNAAAWIAENLRQLVLELKLVPDTVLSSFILIPEKGTELASQTQNRGGPDIPTLLDQPEFLKVLPEQYAPVSGQTDLFPEFTSKLDPPFHRLRHVEYSFGVPQPGQLLAEPWAFFLEVDDSDAFIEELIVPKARLVGGHIGAEKIGDIAGQLLGNLSARRRINGLRPLLFSTPEEAASAGAGIGGQIGGRIGSQVGEEQALKKYDFEGFPLYVSDLKTYTEEMRKIRAEEAGERQRQLPPPILSPRDSLRKILTNLLEGLETGSIDGMLTDRLAAGVADAGSAPLAAEENLVLVLDRKHILIVPGDRDLLHAALERWRDFVDRRGAPAPGDDAGWRNRRDILYGAMAQGQNQILRSAARFDLSAAQAEGAYLQKYYSPNLPNPVDLPVPANLAEPFFIGTNAPGAAFLYTAVPDEFIQFLLKVRQQKNQAPKE
ncbi:MAG: hypothetical protein IJG60_04385 [Thermoguttaceae bacterium]|nr:hypothetical protein [Thermoguttaceae bacterium]